MESKRGKSIEQAQPVPVREADPIGVFCEKHSISEATFHRLVKANKGPRLMRLGKRVLITQDAAREWRARMEGTDTQAAA